MSYSGHSPSVLRHLLVESSHRLIASSERNFVTGLEEIEAILSRLEPAPSPLLQAVDSKGQDFSTYYFAAFSDTRDADLSLLAYDHVKNLVRIIVLMDRFYEVGNDRYRILGQAVVAKLRKEDHEYLRYLVTFALKQFWPFWKFEQYTKKQMLEGHRFSPAEIRRFNLFKSSDAPMIYAPLLESMLPNFDRNASLVVHYNQALQDIDDDLEDVEEDLNDQMPNIFMLAALGMANLPDAFSRYYKHRMNGSCGLILESAAGPILRLVDEYGALVEGVNLPEQFNFLKYLSRHYCRKIRHKLAGSYG